MALDNWKDLEKKAGKGPLSIGFTVIVIVTVLSLGIWATGSFFGYFGEAVQVAREEFGPRAMLKKYEWFKNTSAALDQKLANIKVYSVNRAEMKKDYEGVPRPGWDRTDKEQFNLWGQEVAGVKASYNGLAAEWNAQMSKFNWEPFLSELPKGADNILRKQYAVYVDK